MCGEKAQHKTHLRFEIYFWNMEEPVEKFELAVVEKLSIYYWIKVLCNNMLLLYSVFPSRSYLKTPLCNVTDTEFDDQACICILRR